MTFTRTFATQCGLDGDEDEVNMRQWFIIFWVPYLRDSGPRYITPEEFENAALFILGVPSTLIRHENKAFRKRSSNLRNVKTPALRFLAWNGKHSVNSIILTSLFCSPTILLVLPKMRRLARTQALSCVIKCCLVHGTLLFRLKSSCTIAVINVLSFLSDRYEC